MTNMVVWVEQELEKIWEMYFLMNLKGCDSGQGDLFECRQY